MKRFRPLRPCRKNSVSSHGDHYRQRLCSSLRAISVIKAWRIGAGSASPLVSITMRLNCAGVGFVGLGIMGGRMAANLQKAGYKLVVHDLQRQAASRHLNAGAVWADNPRALASCADVVFSSLPEPPDVEVVALGPDGLIAGMKPGAAYFDLSTNSPSVVKKLDAAFAEKGLYMLDAPVSGGPTGAATK